MKNERVLIVDSDESGDEIVVRSDHKVVKPVINTINLDEQTEVNVREEEKPLKGEDSLNVVEPPKLSGKPSDNQPVNVKKKHLDNTENKQSVLNLGLFDNIALGIGSFLVSVFVLGIGYPIAISIKEKYHCDRKKYSGEELVFNGSYGELFIDFIKWILLTIITFGIYSFWLERNILRWKTKNTHFRSAGNGDKSYFTGTAGGLFMANLVRILLVVFTFGLGIPWANVYKQSYVINNTVISEKRLVFSGTGSNLFGKYIKWFLLSIITFGIYSLWLSINLKKWNVSNTYVSGEVFVEDPKSAPFDKDTKVIVTKVKKGKVASNILVILNIIASLVLFLIIGWNDFVFDPKNIITIALLVALLLLVVDFIFIINVRKKRITNELIKLKKSQLVFVYILNILTVVSALVFAYMFETIDSQSPILQIIFYSTIGVSAIASIYNVGVYSKKQQIIKQREEPSNFIWFYALILSLLVILTATRTVHYQLEPGVYVSFNYLVMISYDIFGMTTATLGFSQLMIAFLDICKLSIFTMGFLFTIIFMVRGFYKKQNIKQSIILIFYLILIVLIFFLIYGYISYHYRLFFQNLVN